MTKGEWVGAISTEVRWFVDVMPTRTFLVLGRLEGWGMGKWKEVAARPPF